MTRIDRARRRDIERIAREIRIRGLRDARPVEEIVDEVLAQLPEVHPLEAWRFAHGWSRAEACARLDACYEADGLAPPRLSPEELCRWEHEQRRPNDERIEYLCRTYRTRPDRLGFGRDHSPATLGHLERAGLIDLFPRTGSESSSDLISRIRNARQRVTMFGLTRNYYARDDVLPLFEAKAADIPVRIYIMDPHCGSRRDRYRLEPAEAAMEDPDRYVREILRPLGHIAQHTPGLQVYLYNFPCSFAMEEIDDVIRVMFYGHGKRGTDSPILTFASGTDYHDYFASQLRWLDRLASGETREPWASKDIHVWPYQPRN